MRKPKGPYVLGFSKLLQEKMAVYPDTKLVCFPGGVWYTKTEIEYLRLVKKKEAIKTLHKLKKEFEGVVLHVRRRF